MQNKGDIIISKNKLIIEGDLVNSLVVFLSSGSNMDNLGDLKSKIETFQSIKRAEIDLQRISQLVKILANNENRNPKKIGISLSGANIKNSLLSLLLHFDLVLKESRNPINTIPLSDIVFFKLELAGLLVVSDFPTKVSFPRALNAVNTAVRISKQLSNPYMYAYSVHQQGMIKFICGDRIGSVESYRKAQQIANLIPDKYLRNILHSAISCDMAPGLSHLGESDIALSSLIHSVNSALES